MSDCFNVAYERANRLNVGYQEPLPEAQGMPLKLLSFDISDQIRKV